ncbi:DnaD domain protein (plasmid) [Mangrovibacillus cuniculi]|uniref:DnaD domain protein n=2 Tax=Mangrovibacillus cuniculi TaxID=2593652 RepID=A0A7S8CEM4_9BACI|nr:DnaD domain protein [Mangrovibacillus cuniculi]QPC48521.1 DnaD domain protein [Mangrovibacillus cuniculi]
MAVNNKTGWKGEFTIANMALQAKTGLSRQQLDRARTELITSNRIIYKKSGKANKAGSYSIVSFDTQNAHKADTGRTHDEHEVTTLVKHKQNKTKLDDEDKARTRDSQNPFIFFEQEGFGTISSFTAERLGSLIDDFGEEKVLRAMQESVLNGARNLKYVQAILNNPKAKGGKANEQKYRRGVAATTEPRTDPLLGDRVGWIKPTTRR